MVKSLSGNSMTVSISMFETFTGSNEQNGSKDPVPIFYNRFTILDNHWQHLIGIIKRVYSLFLVAFKCIFKMPATINKVKPVFVFGCIIESTNKGSGNDRPNSPQFAYCP